MTHSESYYLVKLNPPPRSVRIVILNRSNNTSWENSGSAPCRIQINYLQTGTIREFSEHEHLIYEPGTAYITLLGHCLRQELTVPCQELSMRLFLWEKPIPLTAEEVASRHIVVHEAIIPGLVKDPGTARRIGDLILAAELEAPRGEPLRSLKLRTHMYSMLTLLTQCSIDQARHQLQKQQQDWSRQTKRAVSYIKKHLDEKMSVDVIAKEIGDNYDHLKSLFRRDTGMTLVEYINDQRILKVKELLSVRGTTSESGAEAVGIQDPKYLGRLFRRYTGMTITEYRNLCRENQEL